MKGEFQLHILVTGGAGFIGSHIVDKLIADGHSVRIYDNLKPHAHLTKPEYLNNNAEFIQADIRDSSRLKEAVKDIDIIFHEAAILGIGKSMQNIEQYISVNTLGTSKLLDILVNTNHDVKKLIVASSMSVYGEGMYLCEDCGIVYPESRHSSQFINNEWEIKCQNCGKFCLPIPTNESKPPSPQSIYAVSKKQQEELCMLIGKSYGLPTVALRYFNTFGPRQSLSNPYSGVCSIFSSQLLNKKSPTVFEDGKQTRDFISVHDIVRANCLVMRNSNANYQIYNVGSGRSFRILDVVHYLAKILNTNISPLITYSHRLGDIRHCYADISKIKELGFEPLISLNSGLIEFVGWTKTQSQFRYLEGEGYSSKPAEVG